MLWLVPHVGVRRVLTAEVALPTKTHFPELFQRSGWDVETLFDHACRLMGVERDELELRVSNKSELPDAAGTYCGGHVHGTITVREESLEDPEALLGTMFHELSHHLLLSRKLIDPSEPDHEPTTDLVPVILGLGVFAANSITRESETPPVGGHSTWRIERQGYLSAPEYGYGLALFAWFRGERDPAWTQSLRPDVRVAAKEGLRYLRSDGACSFHPDRLDASGRPRTRPGVRECLESSRPATIVGGLKALNSATLVDELHPALAAALAHADLAVRIEAHAVLVRLERAPASMSGLVVDAIYAADGGARAAATRALGSFDANDPALQKAAERALRDHDGDVVDNACLALQRWKSAPWSTSQILIDIALKHLLVGSGRPGSAAMATFAAVTREPESALRQLELGRTEEERTLLEERLMAILWPKSDQDDAQG